MSPQEIRLLREELGLSRRKFAQLLDVTHRTIGNWEDGRSSPSKMKVDVMRDLRRRARQEKREGTDPQEWVQALLGLAAAGAFGMMLGKIYNGLTNDQEEEE
jgi:transcriptional regulator with XRE-family HTH domain